MNASLNRSDTIVALSTPPGIGAIGVIRISGTQSISMVDAIFKGKNLAKVKGNTVHYGKIVADDGTVVDECLAAVFRAPRSYTREDVVEISCHGSPYILSKVIDLLIEKGASAAKPGEFTFRAFINGQLDLSQAEAVSDLIASESEVSHRLAMNQMRGGFSDDINHLRQELIDFAALIELELDFGEEDVEFADRLKLQQLVEKMLRVIQGLLDSFRLGNVIKHGVSTVIAGRPNAGKSTLLNALLNEYRAIVSDIAGTTRDTIEEALTIRGVKFRIIDTAGIRAAQDTIERLGVERTFEKITSSTIVMYVFDVTEMKPEELWHDVKSILGHQGISRYLFLANKMDLNPYTHLEDYYADGLISEHNLISLSAKNQMNIEYLKTALYHLVIDRPELLDQTMISNSRHVDALAQAKESLTAVLEGLNSGISGDIIAMDIRRALYHLGEITGEIHTDDLLESIFSRFCIGK